MPVQADDLAASVRTSRMTIDQRFLAHTMPRLLGTPIDTTALRPWTTAHGDFHFAELVVITELSTPPPAATTSR